MFKKISLIGLFLIFVLSLSAACAADLNQTDDISVEVSSVNETVDYVNADAVLDDSDSVDESEISSVELNSSSSNNNADNEMLEVASADEISNGDEILGYSPFYWQYTPLDYDDLKYPDQFCSFNVFTCGSILEIHENAHHSQMKLKLKDSNIELIIVYDRNVSHLNIGDEITVFGYGVEAWCGLPVMNMNFFYPGFHENNHVIW